MRVIRSALLLVGGVVTLTSLPLRWSTVTATVGGASLSWTGLDYPAYDIVTTAVFGVALIAVAAALWVSWRWAQVSAVVVALLACMWAALVYLAAQYPADGRSTAGVTVAVGAGAFALAAGAVLALIGAVLSLFHGGVARTASLEPRPTA